MAAYEWNFSDVNPPVHAWAALRVYQGRALYEGVLPEAALLPLSGRYGLLI